MGLNVAQGHLHELNSCSIDGWGALSLGFSRGWHCLLQFLKNRTCLDRVPAGPHWCWILPTAEFLVTRSGILQLLHLLLLFYFFRRVNTYRMFLIPEAAWISSVFLLRAHQEERLVFQQCHCHIWYSVGGVQLHPKKYTVFDCFVGTFVFLFQTKYRKKPDSIKFTSVVDSPDLIHAKNSYMHCNEVSVFSSLIPGTG